jgi:hypothetical protein
MKHPINADIALLATKADLKDTGNTLIKWIVATGIISAIAVSALISAGLAVANQLTPTRTEKGHASMTSSAVSSPPQPPPPLPATPQP